MAPHVKAAGEDGALGTVRGRDGADRRRPGPDLALRPPPCSPAPSRGTPGRLCCGQAIGREAAKGLDITSATSPKQNAHTRIVDRRTLPCHTHITCSKVGLLCPDALRNSPNFS